MPESNVTDLSRPVRRCERCGVSDREARTVAYLPGGEELEVHVGCLDGIEQVDLEHPQLVDLVAAAAEGAGYERAQAVLDAAIARPDAD